jgi:O-antigen ligase
VTERPSQPHSKVLEVAAAIHIAAFISGVSWAFGGNADWVRTPISIWGSVGIVLTLVLVINPAARARIARPTMSWAVPILILNALVLTASFHPGFRQLAYGNGNYLMPLAVHWWLPSAARPPLALRTLWLFDGIYFSCLNLALAVGRRRVLRMLFGFAVANALVLSIFGTVQKLVGSTGIYFGSVQSPQDYFFASFVYDNHWASFIILMLGACIGLVLRYFGGRWGDGFFHGPSFVGVVAAFLLAITIPLSGSRACTLLLGILGCIALAKGMPKFRRAMRVSGGSTVPTNIGLALAALMAIWCAWVVAGDVIENRAAKAKEQVSAMWAQGGIGARSILYHDTWRMAQDRMLFGWGMGSYPSVFSLYNTQVAKGDRIPVVYHDAHSDWLQALAEIGFAGTALIGGAVALPAMALRGRRIGTLPFFLLTGCFLVGAYALVEFPFGNVAVLLAWWLCFFGAVQYGRLTEPPADTAPRT